MVGVAVTAHTGDEKLNHAFMVCWRHNCAKTSKVTRRSRALRPRLVSRSHWIAILEYTDVNTKADHATYREYCYSQPIQPQVTSPYVGHAPAVVFVVGVKVKRSWSADGRKPPKLLQWIVSRTCAQPQQEQE
jgi:hypothetical protein